MKTYNLELTEQQLRIIYQSIDGLVFRFEEDVIKWNGLRPLNLGKKPQVQLDILNNKIEELEKSNQDLINKLQNLDGDLKLDIIAPEIGILSDDITFELE